MIEQIYRTRLSLICVPKNNTTDAKHDAEDLIVDVEDTISNSLFEFKTSGGYLEITPGNQTWESDILLEHQKKESIQDALNCIDAIVAKHEGLDYKAKSMAPAV